MTEALFRLKNAFWAKKQAYLFVIALYLFEMLLWGLPFLVCACPKLTAGHPARGALRTHSRPTAARASARGAKTRTFCVL